MTEYLPIFHGAELPDFTGIDLEAVAQDLLNEWLKDPEALAQALGIREEQLQKLSPEELLKYFLTGSRNRQRPTTGGVAG